jgi:hypothetical protein
LLVPAVHSLTDGPHGGVDAAAGPASDAASP